MSALPKLNFPATRLRARRREGQVAHEEYVPGGLRMTVTLGVRLLAAVAPYVIENEK